MSIMLVGEGPINMPEFSLPPGEARVPIPPPSKSPRRAASTRFPTLGQGQLAPVPRERPSTMSGQSLAPKEMTFELPKLVDLGNARSGSEDDNKDTERRKRIAPRIRLSQLSRGHISSSSGFEDDRPWDDVGPHSDPLTFQSSYFKSSSLLKKMTVQKRHGEMWGSNADLDKSKGFIIHTSRYGWDEISSDSSLCQRERLQAELDYMEEIWRLKRKRESLPHRQPIDLTMGGKKVVFFERMDIMSEIARLKSIVLPTKAKDLYVGRGFKLPPTHALNRVKLSKSISPEGKRGRRGKVLSGSKSEGMQEGGLEAGAWSVTQSAPTELDGDSQRFLSDQEDIGFAPNQFRNTRHMKPVTEEELEGYRRSFKKLDTDKDGHVTFDQVKTFLPKELLSPEAKYVKQIYDIQSSNTFFGQEEYISLQLMCRKICLLSGVARDAFEKINFTTLETSLMKYIDLFKSRDVKESGKISKEELRMILASAIDKDLPYKDDIFREIQDIVMPGADEIISNDYLAFIPYFLFVERK